MRALTAVVAILLFSFPAGWVAAEDLETRANRLEEQLMAPCCGATPLSDHYSGPAEQMKAEIRSMLAEGRTEAEILDHYVATLGEQILSAPPARSFNLLAYFGGLIFFLVGTGVFLLAVRRWRRAEDERQEAEEPPERIDPSYAERLRREVEQLR